MCKTFLLIFVCLLFSEEEVEEKKYSCKDCSYKTDRERDIQNHMRVHTKERPFKCDVCEKTFGYKQVLKTHSHIHKTITPYKCLHCDKYFNQNVTLKDHFKKAHPGENPDKYNSISTFTPTI